MTTIDSYQQVRIIDEFGKLSARNPTITITSTYKSLILSQPIQVLDITPDQVLLEAPEPLLCSTLREKVYLYSPALPGIIIGRLLDLNLTKRKIVLSGLSLCDHGWSERLFDRIKPEPPIYVNVSSNFRSLGHMCVSNLSAAGMRVICIKNKDRCVESDMPVRLTFQLPRDDSLINLPGKVAHVRQAGNLTRLGFHLNPTMSQQRRLSQYVLEQKAKIMKELKTVFISMQQPRHTQDLYF